MFQEKHGTYIVLVILQDKIMPSNKNEEWCQVC